ncbi:CaiB/BaiF CoA transferase family protein [Paraburkholderia graminis]|uniref:CaiB/BaiF CoA transferase family protein n=1 Tax=Paraburkholderia graminis TaxID=60548 RepID=UPI0038B8C8D8
MDRVFKGLKVIDAANYVAAPAAAVMLADFGADVIKIEPPGSGDPYRHVYRMPNLPESEHNYGWNLAARNKRGIALDLKSPVGQAVLHRLVADADVFITNQSPQSRDRLGMDQPRLATLNPRLIYASLTGYGEAGPEAEKPGFDANAYWARSGLADAIRPDPDGPPAVANLGIGDNPTAVTLYAAIVTALLHRERTGCGAWVTTSLLANGVWANSVMVQAALYGAVVPYRRRREEARNALTCFYRCLDGRWFNLLLLQEARDWPRFVQALDSSAVADDKRFVTVESRRLHAPALVRELDAVFAQRDSKEWQRRFEHLDITVGVAARTADALQDEQMRQARVLVQAEGSPSSGLIVDSPFHIVGMPKVPPRPAPDLGEHADDILAEAGYSPEEVAALRQAGAL